MGAQSSEKAFRLVEMLRENRLTIAAAESLTGGMINRKSAFIRIPVQKIYRRLF